MSPRLQLECLLSIEVSQTSVSPLRSVGREVHEMQAQTLDGVGEEASHGREETGRAECASQRVSHAD